MASISEQQLDAVLAGRMHRDDGRFRYALYAGLGDRSVLIDVFGEPRGLPDRIRRQRRRP